MITVPDEIALDLHQVAAYDKLTAEHGGIVWMNVGEGKTRVALLAAHSIIIDDDYNLIVVIARRAAFYDWKIEIATLQLPFNVFESEELPLNFRFEGKTIVLISEGKLLDPLTRDRLCEWHRGGHIGCFIIDEGWLYKNPDAQRSKVLRPLVELHPTVVLSGTIMTARNLVDVYGQVAISGHAKTLGKTLTDFRRKYQTGIANMGYPGSSWYPKPGSYKAIMDAIAPFTYLHMPAAHRVETRSILIKTESLPSQRKLLTELKETAAIEGAFELKNMANIVTKAQQISDGWLKADDGNVKHFESGKVNRLEALVEELLQTEYKMVVWCAFREDINRLAHLTDLFKVKVATLQSGEVFDSTLWQRASCRICLATEASGSSVNHFAQVPYAIYFSQDFKWHSLQQSAGRHTRRSSLHSVAYNIFLHSDKPSLDAQVYWTVRKSMHSEKSFIQALDVKQWIESK